SAWRYARALLCISWMENGIKDFDVWTFFAHSPSHRFPPRRPVMNADFGPSKFGRHSGDDGLAGRRVDFIVRGIDCRPGADPVEVLRRYLTERRSKSARCLSKKAVVILSRGVFGARSPGRSNKQLADYRAS